MDQNLRQELLTNKESPPAHSATHTYITHVNKTEKIKYTYVEHRGITCRRIFLYSRSSL